MEINKRLNTIISHHSLTIKESEDLMEAVLENRLTQVQIASLLTALRMKGESADEILGFIEVMRRYMKKVKTNGLVIDTCGTGGDGKETFNISTAVALVVAGAGVSVAKHGNRNASSLCGSADVLEALEVNINLNPKQAETLLAQTNFTFLFAPLYHPAMKYVGQVRKELKIRTVFNFLGPFVSPAQVKRQIIGVPNIDLAEKLSKVAVNLDYEHLMLVASEDGLDEISLSASTHIFEVKRKKVKKKIISHREFGFGNTDMKEINGGDAKKNAQIIQSILNGVDGAQRNIVLLNSAAALLVAGKVKTFQEGIKEAKESIDTGNAKEVLKKVINYSSIV
ncbi:anthranilate phosphoribosyltransferase [Candidatus Gottesmanbacteria bacterium CG11_big_fil_rev_8_21_14_0_20_37_11]|uniref:Anthranilate phosphoribosyltransferase n=3 Tax=Candidatus Gottesmaniibacteriota TaxID=1752720 RepID=A0A2M7RRL0_9BACT|nr:MAG: anthranilate phosphoribosyltransferase [Candidatus Gottesmanbacteria bacterium CG1_02_37_22]PIP33014.1 MAG: anthranilate phosphoribosyltransferase [Candidatus Gottesmanbacteria bacterium CG23_combo_of_CG06-09_8_20_14_all_37_19]PIR07654.1 MAG: anthranilate phosphoribosyltransferase [Candidatus Gottesmanbacteria bacterium CG11_big_fil_rev_8_21_14_0_20_37_11]PIZ02938.1 MAG: anthranilate phosphoribosyltransferase [Candidatus Gottesmanbacteria bacterium CG_4_10_14_0_8_um_filter_37_24]